MRLHYENAIGNTMLQHASSGSRKALPWPTNAAELVSTSLVGSALAWQALKGEPSHHREGRPTRAAASRTSPTKRLKAPNTFATAISSVARSPSGPTNLAEFCDFDAERQLREDK